ncbi:copper radical oxidase [Coprinopsis sp. MPI-PUGE-AT-0042]|nr:copper radical oxidase [Coprinopsis sp. MPI-PUGE-AT-0042]
MSSTLLVGLALTSLAYGQLQDAKAQAARNPGVPGTFEFIGNSLVSAQQMFLGTPETVYFVDKVENNPTRISDHPAWGSEWNLSGDRQRAMDVMTNSFCAGGNVLGNGTWINVGGNQAVTYGGETSSSQDGGPPYNNPDGRQSLLDPCTDGSCDWTLSPTQSGQRWYPTLETLEDGSIIIIGGCKYGGYVNDVWQDNPTYEFFPPTGAIIFSPLLTRTLPANLYPLTWLLPDGNLLIQSNWETAILDYKENKETPWPTGGSIMLPLTPANNYTATILWIDPGFIAVQQPPSASCVTITPATSANYTQDDPLPEARSMLNLVQLPDGSILGLNGTAGYGNTTWAIGQSYADKPILTPALYTPSAQPGSRWSRDGFNASNIPRMYHSSALLLPDGSVLVSGSNPNSDYNPTAMYPTEYRTEDPVSTVVLSSDDLSDQYANANKTKAVIVRPGFSTHAINMGQRYLELQTSFTSFANNDTAILHVSQLPPNAALLAPGPALLFIVVDGVPSIGVQVMVGSGKIEEQPMLPPTELPPSRVLTSEQTPGDGEQGRTLDEL